MRMTLKEYFIFTRMKKIKKKDTIFKIEIEKFHLLLTEIFSIFKRQEFNMQSIKTTIFYFVFRVIFCSHF